MVTTQEAMFHEARHSDGNRASLTFRHTYCPVGHDYAYGPFCDRNFNGPYSISAAILKAAVAHCNTDPDCNEIARTQLRLSFTDRSGRILQHIDPATSAHFRIGGELPQPTDWDDTPEGTR